MAEPKTVTKVRFISLPKPPDSIRTPALAGALGLCIAILATEDARTGFFIGSSAGLAWELAATEAVRFSRRPRTSRPGGSAQALAYSIPGFGQSKIDPKVGGHISRSLWSFLVPPKRAKELRPTLAPVFGRERFFRSLGIELSGATVETFLRSAWSLRERGRGLSARRWSGENGETLPPLWEPIYYRPAMHLLYEAEAVVRRQLVIENTENGWRRMARPWRETYNILWYVETLKVSPAPGRRSLLSAVFGN